MRLHALREDQHVVTASVQLARLVLRLPRGAAERRLEVGDDEHDGAGTAARTAASDVVYDPKQRGAFVVVTISGAVRPRGDRCVERLGERVGEFRGAAGPDDDAVVAHD